MTKDLLKRYLRINILTLIINFMIVYISEKCSNDGDSFSYPPLMAAIITSIFTQLLALSTLTMFANLKRIAHTYSRLCSFFGLPVCLFVYVIILDPDTTLPFILLHIPFFLITFREYYLFNKKFPLHPS